MLAESLQGLLLVLAISLACISKMNSLNGMLHVTTCMAYLCHGLQQLTIEDSFDMPAAFVTVFLPHFFQL